MNEKSPNNPGIFQSLIAAFRLLVDSFMEGMGYRSELFEMELQEVTERYFRLYMMLQVAVFAIFIAFLCLNVLILVLFWDYRILASLILFIVYLLTGLLLVRHIIRKSRSAQAPFSATIEVLKQDQVALMSEPRAVFEKK
jgi:uncharacterized membrane protein YqjE